MRGQVGQRIHRFASHRDLIGFTLADVGKLPEAVSFSDAGSVERTVLDLWNMPIIFLALLLLKAGEWLLRLYWGRL